MLFNSLQEVIGDLKPLDKAEVKKQIKKAKTERNEAFDIWWKSYLPTSTWVDGNGKEWFGGRNLKVLKPKCQEVFLECIAEGDNPGEMIKTLEYEYSVRKKKSLLEGKNDLNFVQLTSTYLNQRSHRSWIELMKAEGEKILSPLEEIKSNMNTGGFL